MKYNKLKIELDVSNLEKSLVFYKDLLGFEVEYERKENRFVALELEEIYIMLQDIGSEMMDWKTGKLEYPFGRGVNFTIKPSNLNEIYKRFTAESYPLFKNMTEHWFKKDNGYEAGLREFLVQDPDGYLFRIGESLGDRKIDI